MAVGALGQRVEAEIEKAKPQATQHSDPGWASVICSPERWMSAGEVGLPSVVSKGVPYRASDNVNELLRNVQLRELRLYGNCGSPRTRPGPAAAPGGE